MKAIIAGGGIGGLVAAISLHDAGFEVESFESVRELRPLGVGINLLPHAVRELDELGLGAELEEMGIATAELVYFSKHGKRIWSEPRGRAAGYRWPQISIHRGRLQMFLLREARARLGPNRIHTGHHLYPGGRPNWLSRRLNAGSAWVFALGILPSFVLSLETKGRMTGRAYRIPLVAAEVGGEWYLVSMLGETADWVRNVRAAGGEAVLRHGKVEHVRLEDVPIAQRAPILKEYLRRAPGARPHFEVAWTAPVHDFDPIAARYPVFRVVRG